MDWNIISALAAVGSAIVAIIAGFALKAQIRQGYENLSSSVLRDHERQFFYSEDFIANRGKCCRFLLGQLAEELSDENNDVAAPNWLENAVVKRQQSGGELLHEGWEIVDFLDSLAIYGDQGTVDVEMAFAHFYYYYSRYWFLLEPWISDFRELDGKVDYYRDIGVFWKEMVRYGKQERGLEVHIPRYSREEIREFLEIEIKGPARDGHKSPIA